MIGLSVYRYVDNTNGTVAHFERAVSIGEACIGISIFRGFTVFECWHSGKG